MGLVRSRKFVSQIREYDSCPFNFRNIYRQMFIMSFLKVKSKKHQYLKVLIEDVKMKFSWIEQPYLYLEIFL